MTSHWLDKCDTITWIMTSNSLDTHFISGDIHDWSCKNIITIEMFSFAKFVYCIYLIFGLLLEISDNALLPLNVPKFVDIVMPLNIHARNHFTLCYHQSLNPQNHGPLARYVKLRVAHATGMPGKFSRRHGLAIPTCITARAWRTCRDACRDR